MEYRLEKDAIGVTWLVVWEKRTSESGDRFRFPLNRLHKVCHYSNGSLEIMLIDARSGGGTYHGSDNLTVDANDAQKFLNTLFPKGRDDGPYR